ncbi:hypothetical protein C8J56DRAFT_1046505 [Mycena floridula]|nr:hypothetical protein C8J56DRAFT_1046505 [Mycena floridula]
MGETYEKNERAWDVRISHQFQVYPFLHDTPTRNFRPSHLVATVEHRIQSFNNVFCCVAIPERHSFSVVVQALVTTGRRWTVIPRSSSIDSDASASQRAPRPTRTLDPQLREPPDAEFGTVVLTGL